MRISKINIANVLGIEQMEIAPGKITTITGKNGEGKSSALKAIQNLMGGGSLSEIKNINTDNPPEIVLHLEGDEGEIIVKKTDKKISVRKQIGTSAAFEDVPKPQSFLNTLFDGRLSNPVSFLTAKTKERVDLMLEAIDLPYDEAELFKQMGLKPCDWPRVDGNVHPLAAIDYHRQNIFSERTGVNRDEKSKRASAQELLQDLPAETEEPEDIEEKETALREMERTKTQKEEELRAEAEKRVERANVEFESTANAIEFSLQQAEQALRAQMEQKMKTKKEEAEQAMGEAREKKHEAKEKAWADHKREFETVTSLEPTISNLKAEIAAQREVEKMAASIEALKAKARAFEAESAQLAEHSQMLTDALGALDQYKATMCSQLPVPGLEIDGNQVLIDGVKWEQLNTAKQIEVAVKIATLRSEGKPLPIVWVDGAEALDSESLAMLHETLAAAGVQGFIASVSNGPLEVGKE